MKYITTIFNKFKKKEEEILYIEISDVELQNFYNAHNICDFPKKDINGIKKIINKIDKYPLILNEDGKIYDLNDTSKKDRSLGICADYSKLDEDEWYFILFIIKCFEDEWYIVEINYTDCGGDDRKSWAFKCDTIDGVYQLIPKCVYFNEEGRKNSKKYKKFINVTREINSKNKRSKIKKLFGNGIIDKLSESNSEKYYSQISIQEWDNTMDDFGDENFTEKEKNELENIRSLINSWSYSSDSKSGLTIHDNQVSIDWYIMKYGLPIPMGIYIYKKEDSWYMISFRGSFFKADEFMGVLDFLSDLNLVYNQGKEFPI